MALTLVKYLPRADPMGPVTGTGKLAASAWLSPPKSSLLYTRFHACQPRRSSPSAASSRHDDVLRRHAASLLGLLPKLLLWPRSCCSLLHSTAPALSPHSLPVLTPKLTCGLLVPVLDQGLVEMNFFITIQPSSLGITTTVAECSWLHPTHCG